MACAGSVVTLAGGGSTAEQDGLGTDAGFGKPSGIGHAVLDNVDTFFVRSRSSWRVVKPSTRAASSGCTLRKAALSSASLCNAHDESSQQSSQCLNGSLRSQIADALTHRIRKMVLVNGNLGNVTTVAGSTSVGGTSGVDGIGTNALFNEPSGVATRGPEIFVTEAGGHRIRRIQQYFDDVSGTMEYQVTTIAGSGFSGYSDGYGSSATFDSPVALKFLWVPNSAGAPNACEESAGRQSVSLG